MIINIKICPYCGYVNCFTRDDRQKCYCCDFPLNDVSEEEVWQQKINFGDKNSTTKTETKRGEK